MGNEIVLPAGAEHVASADISDLISTALHPEPPANAPKIITKLHRCAKWGASEQTTKSDGWPLAHNDWYKLREIFAELPPLKLPITEQAWRPYALAFKQRARDLDWTLGFTVHTASLEASVKRAIAKSEHSKLLHDSISNGTLEQLNPVTRIATTFHLTGGIVRVEALAAYVKQFGIDVVLSPQNTDNT
jgi:hypothetical protein